MIEPFRLKTFVSAFYWCPTVWGGIEINFHEVKSGESKLFVVKRIKGYLESRYKGIVTLSST